MARARVIAYPGESEFAISFFQRRLVEFGLILPNQRKVQIRVLIDELKRTATGFNFSGRVAHQNNVDLPTNKVTGWIGDPNQLGYLRRNNWVKFI